MHESMNPKRIKESALFHLDGRLVLVLEALQDGKAKVKIVGEADELVVPVSRLSLKPTHDETDMDVILEINELALALRKVEAEIEKFKSSSNEAAKIRNFRMRLVGQGDKELQDKFDALEHELNDCDEEIISLNEECSQLKKEIEEEYL